MKRLTLVQMPLSDPTLPYHSTAYLAGSLRSAGFAEVVQRDLNIEFVDWCLSPEAFDCFERHARKRLARLDGEDCLDHAAQHQYYSLWSRPEICFELLESAVETLRSPRQFFVYRDYQQSVERLRSYLSFVGDLSYPAAIGECHLDHARRFSLAHGPDLFDRDLARQVCWPFLRFVETRLDHDQGFVDSDCLGISVTYQHQFLYAAELARWYKNRWPERKVLLGGTEVSKFVRALRNERWLEELFKFCDGVVVGEGETAICEIADAGFALEPGARARNLLTYDRGRQRVHRPDSIHFEDLRRIAAPHYDCDWDLYLSPERAVNYSPTRGCYWNRCAFCNYGISEGRPTSPWRTRPAEQVVAELGQVQTRHDVQVVYFAVDAISPRYQERLADALIKGGLGLSWSAELRLDEEYTPALCEKLVASGCVSALFGMESACQRVLDLMDKGTKVERMSRSLKSLHASGIAVQVMTFGGFPGERPEERQETLKFLRHHRPYWANACMEEFVLLSGSKVAQQPQRYGIEVLDLPGADVDIARPFRELSSPERDLSGAARESEREEAALILPKTFQRPWAGGGDTFHSILYYRERGPDFFKDHPLVKTVEKPEAFRDDLLPRCRVGCSGHVQISHFDMGEMMRNFSSALEQSGGGGPVARFSTQADYAAWVSELPVLKRHDHARYWLQNSERCLEIHQLAFELIQRSQRQNETIGALLKAFPVKVHEPLLDYFAQLARRGLLSFSTSSECPSNVIQQPGS